MIYWQLFLSFLQIGALSFGGGYAAMPLIESPDRHEPQLAHDDRVCQFGHDRRNDAGADRSQRGDICRHEDRRRARRAGRNRRLHSSRVYSGDADREALSQIPQSFGAAKRTGFAAPGGRGDDRVGRRHDFDERLMGWAHGGTRKHEFSHGGIFALCFLLLRKTKLNPIAVMVLAGVLNLAAAYIGL